MAKEIRFRYRNAEGETTERALANWVEIGNYLRGIDTAEQTIKTFRKDRVVEYLDGSEALLENPHQDSPSLSSHRKADRSPQIVFTGFPRVQRATLEERARSAGLDVRQSVTKGCVYLVAGPNAGPSKMDKAREQRVYILSEPQFFVLLRTGELPAEPAISLCDSSGFSWSMLIIL